ncbi:MAG: carboxy terminal-processing peptidase [Verrucomicrobia bacterium]|nr:carboxy terminal-processing peptidase [Verrucomicrobiota bacterium]
MNPPSGTLARLLCLALVALFVGDAGAATDRKRFTTSPTLAAEASMLTKLLDELHYNRDAVRSADYANVVETYMGDLDGQRLFFLGTDRARFMEEYSKNVYYNAAFLGNINAAYEIFYVYQERVESRIAWIFAELGKEFDFTAKESYRADRQKSEWPASATAADELWRRRLKFELVQEILNKKTVEEAKTQVRKRYERMLKNLGEIEGNDLAEIFLSNIARLYDPHSTYFSAATYEDFGIQMKLQLVGIGALLGVEDDVCVVKEIVPGGPADLGRELKPNDKIISVAEKGGEPVEIIGMKLRKIVDKIRGKKGTQVSLMVQPANATDSSVRREIVITRDTVKLNSARARGAVFEVPEADGKTQPIGVITLPAFYGPAEEGDTDSDRTTASRDVARLIEQLKAQNITGLVLDLRRNGGGFLTEAIELAGLFIGRGPVVQVKHYNGEIHVDSDRDPKISYAGPLAVLVDRFSASASEIVAGALQNYGRAIVVGDSSTHGKGTVQQVIEMKNVSRALALAQKTGAAKLTIQKYYLPSGASTQLKGVVPDIVLPSIEDFLPIGEGDLPRALVWDQIPTSFFDGEPLDSRILNPLRQASLERQANLEEFAYLRKIVDRFKTRQEQKLISVNLEERRQQKADEDAFRRETKAEKEQIAKSDFSFKPYYLGPPPVPKIRAPKKDADEDDELAEVEEENETYVKADIHLRETLRVVRDAVIMGRNRPRHSLPNREDKPIAPGEVLP